MKLEYNNQGQQQELNIARGLAVIFMVMIHVFVVFAVVTIYDDAPLYSTFVEFVGGIPAAPVFMFILGVGIIYSKNSQPRKLIYRGLYLILMGYFLNLLRFFLPTSFFYMRYNIFYDNMEVFYQSIFVGDILQFAGLALIFMALIVKLKLDRKHIILLLIIIAIINQFTPHITGTYLTAPFIALFIGGNEQLSFFPFISWIFYPISGYLFATYLIETTNKKLLYKKILLTTVPILIIYTLLIIIFNLPTGYETDAAYYFQSGLINIIYTVFVLFWISIIYFISPYINKHLLTFLNSASKYVSEIYFNHWVIIGIITIFIPRQSLTLPSILFYTLSIYVITHLITILVAKIKAYF